MHSTGPARVSSWWGTKHDRMTVESAMLISGMLLLLKILFLFLFLFWELPLAKAVRLSNPKYFWNLSVSCHPCSPYPNLDVYLLILPMETCSLLVLSPFFILLLSVLYSVARVICCLWPYPSGWHWKFSSLVSYDFSRLFFSLSPRYMLFPGSF